MSRRPIFLWCLRPGKMDSKLNLIIYIQKITANSDNKIFSFFFKSYSEGLMFITSTKKNYSLNFLAVFKSVSQERVWTERVPLRVCTYHFFNNYMRGNKYHRKSMSIEFTRNWRHSWPQNISSFSCIFFEHT